MGKRMRAGEAASGGELREHRRPWVWWIALLFLLWVFFQWEFFLILFFSPLSYLCKIIIRLNLGNSLSSIWNWVIASLGREGKHTVQSANYLKGKTKDAPKHHVWDMFDGVPNKKAFITEMHRWVLEWVLYHNFTGVLWRYCCYCLNMSLYILKKHEW